MRTLVLEQPGELRLTEADPPGAPQTGLAVVRVLRVGVCGTDVHAWRGEQPFFTYPRVLGHELAVEVVSIGAGVTEVQPGDRCAVEPYINCGACRACRLERENCCERMQVLGVHRDGGMRDLFEVPARKLHSSRVLSADALALTEMLSIGAHAVSRAAPTASHDVLVLGAGPIGLGVALFAIAAGARVLVADVDPRRLEFCRSQLQPHTVIDASAGPIEPSVRQSLAGELPGVVFDATGNRHSMATAFKLVAHAGTLVFVGLVLGDLSFDDPDFHRRETTLLASRNALPEDFRQVLRALEAGRVDVPRWVTHRAGLNEVVDAFPKWTRPGTGIIKAMIEVF